MGTSTFFNDINQDGEKELIILLTTSTGTGVHQEEIHVINPNNFLEVDIENPFNVIEQRVNTKIMEDGKNVVIKIVVNNKETIINMKKEYAVEWFDYVYFAHVIHYQIIDNKLIAEVAAQVSVAGFVGEIEISYMFDDNKYKANTIEFKSY